MLRSCTLLYLHFNFYFNVIFIDQADLIMFINEIVLEIVLRLYCNAVTVK